MWQRLSPVMNCASNCYDICKPGSHSIQEPGTRGTSKASAFEMQMLLAAGARVDFLRLHVDCAQMRTQRDSALAEVGVKCSE